MMNKDIFVSYSRRNQEICRKLVAALARTERDTWVDWEGIPLSADWWSEIERGIENAETILVLLSNDWLSSPICHLEMTYALSLNKRVVPVVYGDIDSDAAFSALAAKDLDAAARDMLQGRDISGLARDNWRALSKINWAFYREEDFTEGASKLLAALQTDLAHARAHTRLLNRALEWVRGGHETSLLLRGIDLDQAVGWLAYNADKEPLPTAQHRAYIAASVAQREAEAAAEREQQARELALKARALNRARMLIASLAIFLVVAAFLTLFALQQRSEAIDQRDRADSNAQVAKAREIAAQAVGLMNNRPAQAMLLSIAAYQTQPVFEAESALLTLMTSSKGLTKTVRDGQGEVAASAFSPDGQRVAVIRLNNPYLVIYDLNGEAVARLDSETLPIFNSVQFLTNDTLRVSGTTSTMLWQLHADNTLSQISETPLVEGAEVIYLSAYNADASLMAAATVNSTDLSEVHVVVYSLASGDLLRRERLEFYPEHLEFNESSTALLILNEFTFSAGGGWYWDLTTDSPLQALTLPDEQLVLRAYFYDERFLLLLTVLPGESRTIALYDPQTGEYFNQITVPTSISHLYLHPTKDTVIAPEYSGKVRLYSLNGQVEYDVLNFHEYPITSTRVSPDGQTLLLGDEESLVTFWRLDARPRPQIILESTQSPIISMSLVNDKLALVAEDGFARIYDLATYEWTEVAFGQLEGEAWDNYPNIIRLLPDQRRAITLTPQGLLRMWDAQTGALLVDMQNTTTLFTTFATSPDGKWLATYQEDGGIQLWETDSLAALGDITRLIYPDTGFDFTARFVDFTFSPDSQTLAILSQDGGVWLYRVTENGLKTPTIYQFDTQIQSVARFSPDGKILAFGSISGAIFLVDVQTGKQIFAPLAGSQGQIYDMAFRPDGRTLAAVDTDNFLWLWDTARGVPIGTPMISHYLAYGIAFSDDGEHLISVGSNPTLTEWDFSPEFAQQRLCAVTGRDLTPEEWALYVGDAQDYQPVCAGL